MISQIEAENVTRRFGGIVALSEVNFSAKSDEIVGLIGPNGAGKTTLFSIISGLMPPSEGTVRLNGEEITRSPAFVRARLGIGRTFQICRPFRELSLLENVVAGAYLGAHNYNDAVHIASTVLNEVGLSGKRDYLAGQVTLQELKRLELARALATKPKFLLLDEVMAGLNLQEQHSVASMIEEIHARGIGIVMVEHSLAMVVRLCDRVIALDQGRAIAEGSADTVMASAAVRAVYMGV